MIGRERDRLFRGFRNGHDSCFGLVWDHRNKVRASFGFAIESISVLESITYRILVKYANVGIVQSLKNTVINISDSVLLY